MKAPGGRHVFSEHHLHSPGNFVGDPGALGDAVTIDVSIHSGHAGKIGLRNCSTLSAAEFLGKPLRQPVAGIQDRDGNLLAQLTPAQAQELVNSGAVTGGMIPKVRACVRALATVGRAHVIDGRVPHALLRELFTDAGVGTMIVGA